MKRKVVATFLTIILLFTTVTVNVSFASTTQAYAECKDYAFSASDINSQVIQQLYSPSTTTIPSSYNLKDHIQIQVTNQENVGLCDTFATVKCAETNYELKTGEHIDLSERYLSYMQSNDFYGERVAGVVANSQNHYNGEEGDGTSGYSIMALLETFGSALEDDVPYTNYSQSQYDTLRNAKCALRVSGAVEFPCLTEITNQNLKNQWFDILKLHVMKYGAIRVAILSPIGGYYNYDHNSYYFEDGDQETSGHAVTIVGWDDSFPKENFNKPATRDGAFICLNSWGESWGDNGYFYISYDDDSITDQLYGVIDTTTETEFNEYTYAEKLVTENGLWTAFSDDRYYGMKFEKQGDTEYLSHLTIGSNCFKVKFVGGTSIGTDRVPIKCYLNPQDDSFDESKMILLSESTQIWAGCLSINLDNPIKITGDKFSLVFKFEVSNDYDIYFRQSKSNTLGQISGNLYVSSGFDSNWSIASGYDTTGISNPKDFPVYVFTTNTGKELELSTDKYIIDGTTNFITKVSPNTSVKTLLENIQTNAEIKVVNKQGVQVTGETLVGTGYKVQVQWQGTTYEYSLAVAGDVSNDGKITATDLSTISQVILGKITLTELEFKALDLDGNGRITVTDLSALSQAISGKIRL